MLFWSKCDIQRAGVSLKMRSRSPTSNHFFPMFQWCFCASLVKIHQLVLESADKAHSYSPYSAVTLKIRSWPSKSDQNFKPSQRYNIWSSAHNLSFDSRDRVQTSFFGQNLTNFTVFIVWWPWKLGQGHQNLTKSLHHPNVTIYEAWPESAIWFKRQGADKLFWTKFENFKVLLWPWKWGQGHQNLITSFFPPSIGDRVQTISNADANGICIKSNISPIPFGWEDIIYLG